MCGVRYSLWLGTENGEVIILDLISKSTLYRRHLSIHADQSIVGLYHLVSIGSVVSVLSVGSVVSVLSGV